MFKNIWNGICWFLSPTDIIIIKNLVSHRLQKHWCFWFKNLTFCLLTPETLKSFTLINSIKYIQYQIHQKTFKIK